VRRAVLRGGRVGRGQALGLNGGRPGGCGRAVGLGHRRRQRFELREVLLHLGASLRLAPLRVFALHLSLGERFS